MNQPDILEVALLGNPVLTRKCDPVPVINGRILDILRAMADTMLWYQAVGLAAPQVMEPRRMLVALYNDQGTEHPVAMINPEIVKASKKEIIPANPDAKPGDPDEFEQIRGVATLREGCLSIPGLLVEVERPTDITVKYQDLAGAWQEVEATGDFARYVQHEMDHLDGLLLTRFLTRQGRRQAERDTRDFIRKLKQAGRDKKRNERIAQKREEERLKSMPPEAIRDEAMAQQNPEKGDSNDQDTQNTPDIR